MAITLNETGLSHARSLIRQGRIDTTSSWSFDADDGNALLGASLNNWARFGRMHLAQDTEATPQTKQRFKFPFGKLKNGREVVFRRALIAIRQRASAQNLTRIFNAAGELLEMIDQREERSSRKISIPKLSTRAIFQPETLNEEKRTVDVVFSTGAPVRRSTFFGQTFIEELEITPKSVKLDRFKNGAPVLKDHKNSIDSIVGVVESARVVKNELIGTVRFSKRQEAEDIFREVKDGFITNVSIGYAINRVEEINEEGADPIFRVKEFEPMEVSLVAVPADAGAKIRKTDDVYDCFVETRTFNNNEEPIMIEEKKEDEVKQDAERHIEVTNNENLNGGSMSEKDLAKIKEEAARQERERCTQIRAAVSHARLDQSLADEMIEKGVSVSEARGKVLELLAKKDEETKTKSSNITVGADLTREGYKQGIYEAILNRVNPKKYQLSEQSKDFSRSRLIDMARDYLELTGTKTRGLSSMEIATRSLHSTSDFPEILANVSNKTLRDAYQESPQTFRPFVRTVTVSDFKEISRTQLGDAPALKKKLENGEYESGTVSEQAEKYSVEEYGRMIRIGRRVLVNDDLSAFQRLPEMFGRQAANLESDLIWGIVTSNPLMADGNALFSAAHANLAAAGTAISISSLGEGREAMRLQKGLDGNRLNIRPSWLVVPAALETVADQFTTQITPDLSGNVNPFQAAGRSALTPVAEPRLDDASSTAWYLFSDVSAIDIFEMAFLVGEEGPVIDQMIDFDSDGMKMKVRHTVGVKAIDHRGVYKNPGA